MGNDHEPDRESAIRERPAENMQGHWLLARLGKRVLRPGGRQMTEDLLRAAEPAGRRVVELAPGLGLTASRILDYGPSSYTGIERDHAAATTVRELIGTRGQVMVASAEHTGLAAESADLVLGEAMLTMQSDRGKREILTEVRRVLAGGGRYAIHELGLRPDGLDDAVKDEVRRELARSIKVNARPLTLAEWRALLEGAGFEVEWAQVGEMALLEPRRLLADEGPRGVTRILANALRDREARRRVLDMRRTFRAHADSLCAVALVARAR